MITQHIHFLPILLLLVFSRSGAGQAPCVVYDANDYQGAARNLNIGEEIIFTTGNGLSFQINDPSAALKVARTMPVYGDGGGNAPYPSMFVYTESSQPFMTNEGPNGQFRGIEMRAVCLLKKAVPEPEIYVPVDGNNMPPNDAGNPAHQVPVKGKRMLMLKRAFFWENSEQLDSPCPEAHGPYAALGVSVFDPKILDYSFSRLNVQNNYSPLFFECNVDTHLYRNDAAYRQYVQDNPCDFPCFSGEDCMGSLKIPHSGCKLYGPVYHAVTPNCELDFGWFGSIDFGAPPDAFNEWTDGPWGCVYSNVGLLNWDDYPGDKVVVGVVEGDQYHDYVVLDFGTLDDFLGGGVITRDMKGEILINVGAFGWLVVKNETIGMEPAEETTRHFWYPTWDGSYPEAVCGPLYPITAQEIKDDFCVTEKQLFIVQTPYLVNINSGDSIRMPDVIVVSNPDYSLDTFPYLDYILQQNLSAFTIIANDTIVEIPAREYRSWGSQYKPYYELAQVETFVPEFDSVGVYNGVIPASNHLTKEITYLPLDPTQKFHRDSIVSGKRKAQSFPTGQKPAPGGYTMDRNYRSDKGGDSGLKIYPTLANGSITIERWLDKPSVLDLWLVSSLGKVIKTEFSGLHFDQGLMTENVSLSGLEQGIYFIQILDRSSGKIQSARFIKSN